MPDNNQRNQAGAPNGANPWMRPMGANMLQRGASAPKQPTAQPSPYTPNETDENEALYAARAAAAMRRAAANQGGQPQIMQGYVPQQPAAPAQQNAYVRGGAMQGYVPQRPATPAQQPSYHRDAAQGYAAQRPAAPAQQPSYHREAAQGYAAQRPAAPAQQPSYHRDAAQGYAAQRPAAPAQQPSYHREAAQGYVPQQSATPAQQPSYDHEAAQGYVPQQSATPAQQPSYHREAAQGYILRQPAAVAQPESVHRAGDASLSDPMLQEEAALSNQPRRRRSRVVMRQEQEMAAAQPEAKTPIESSAPVTQAVEPAPIAAPIPVPEMPAWRPVQPQQTDAFADLPLPPQEEPSPAREQKLSELPMDDAFRALVGAASDEDATDEEQDDCQDTASMPMPAPVSTLEPLPKVRKSGWLKALIAVMLLAAVGVFLYASGLGEKAVHAVVNTVHIVTGRKVNTGMMKANPEQAGTPATITVTLETASNIQDVRLLNGSKDYLGANVSSVNRVEGKLWSMVTTLYQPYDGLLLAEVLCEDGQWRMANSQCHVTVN